MSSIFRLRPFSRSISSKRSTPAFFSTRSVLRSARLTLSCTGASLVAIKRVPMLMPAAPIARAATRLRASAMPPDATNGIFNSSAARGSRIMLGMSSSPGCPPHSKPSTLTGVAADLLGLQGMPDRGAFVDHLDAGGLQRRHVLLGAAARGFNDFDAAFPDGRDVFRIRRRGKRRQESQIDAERLVRDVVTARDLLGQQLR